jgi:hypothetical protein
MMNAWNRSFRPAIAAGVAALLLSGCAVTRSTIDIAAPPAQAGPTSAYATITMVRDARRFEANPRAPSTPSLQDPEEIKNPAITSRAVARKRGGLGAALADILLPEGRTVEQVVREAATTALREQGYAVVDERSPDRARAVPVELIVQQFWSWFSPGFAAISVEFEGIVRMRSDLLVAAPTDLVRGYARIQALAATDEEWSKAMHQGVTDLTAKM